MRFITADHIFNGEKLLDAGSVLVLENNGTISDILREGTIENNRVEKSAGWLCPGFINIHAHLELSHLKDKIPQQTGLAGFGEKIISIRPGFKNEEIREAMQQADAFMFNEGIVACGDICNTADSLKMKEGSSIHYHSFIELLALNPDRANDMLTAGKYLFDQFENAQLSCSLAPHAAYSSSKKLIAAIAQFNIARDLPASIHNQESEEENKFFNGEPSAFHNLYRFLNMDISWFLAPGCSSLMHYTDALSTQQTILIHNTFTSSADLNFMNTENIYFGFCPNANIYIENQLPDFKIFESYKTKITLGTDSLASNYKLSLIDEANVVLKNSNFTVEEVLRFMTLNGARALKLPEHFGKISIGKTAGLNLLQIKNNQINFTKRIC
ncbi:MAG: amidohydrolase family protein [Sphingobacteriaceae bacterium]|nr:amidohydrolase family protein [Sphingobacteriaceae bacterium]